MIIPNGNYLIKLIHTVADELNVPVPEQTDYDVKTAFDVHSKRDKLTIVNYFYKEPMHADFPLGELNMAVNRIPPELWLASGVVKSYEDHAKYVIASQHLRVEAPIYLQMFPNVLLFLFEYGFFSTGQTIRWYPLGYKGHRVNYAKTEEWLKEWALHAFYYISVLGKDVSVGRRCRVFSLFRDYHYDFFRNSLGVSEFMELNRLIPREASENLPSKAQLDELQVKFFNMINNRLSDFSACL